MASGDAVRLIKERLNILDVVGQYVELHRAGKHFKGRCPFHGEKTPSFHVSPERGTYHCFGCGVGGDIFSFIEAIDGVDFKEALKTLAQKANVELVPEAAGERTLRDDLKAVVEAATSFYEQQLPGNAEAMAYLERRGVTKETIKKWRIGYAPGPPTGGWREVKQHLNGLGFNDDLLLRAGLVKTAEGGKEPFDVFRDRVMFPLRDSGGHVVAFSGRILHPDDKSPKYVNSPETALYHKSELLYGYDIGKHHIRQLPFWLVVEGQFDVVMSHQAGYSTAVAVSGTALTDHHVTLLERLSKNVVLALDADKAGIAAMRKAADIMLRRGMDVKVAQMPDGADPADMVLGDLPTFKTAISDAIPVIEFFLAHLRTLTTDERAYKLHVRDEVIPLIPLIPNRIDQDHFEGVVAGAIDTTKDAVHYEVVRIAEQAKKPESVSVTPPPSPQPAVRVEQQQKALAYLVAATAVFADPVPDRIKTAIATITGTSYHEVVAQVPEQLVGEITFTIETRLETTAEKFRLRELLEQLELFRVAHYRDQLAKKRALLNHADSDTMTTLLTEIGRLSAALAGPPYDEVFLTTPLEGD